MPNYKNFDVVIIGGGFYGCRLALEMRAHFKNIVIVEKENDILTRASYINQARIHKGYHYPRSFVTAVRSRINFPIFNSDFRKAVVKDFEKIYAIARNGSKVNAKQFLKFCKRIEAPIKPAPESIKRLFNKKLIEEVFCVQEYAFDANVLRNTLKTRLNKFKISLKMNTCVEKISADNKGNLIIHLKDKKDLVGKYVFNCTYSQINSILKASKIPLVPLKHEVTEMALVKIPDHLEKLGITIMDGPFFSTMPFPARKLHSLSHVRYTPHTSWLDTENYRIPYDYLKNLKIKSNFPYMIRGAQRYIPTLAEAKYVDSLYEIKTLLPRNEVDDGRPILFRKDYGFKNFFVILGGKIDNIYDVIQTLEETKFWD